VTEKEFYILGPCLLGSPACQFHHFRGHIKSDRPNVGQVSLSPKNSLNAW
jgi:hypothetical protein